MNRRLNKCIMCVRQNLAIIAWNIVYGRQELGYKRYLTRFYPNILYISCLSEIPASGLQHLLGLTDFSCIMTWDEIAVPLSCLLSAFFYNQFE